MLSYNNVVSDANGIKYSIDMIRVSLSASEKSYQCIFDTVLQNEEHKKITYKQSFADQQYRHFYSIEYYGFGVVKLGFSLNGATREQAQSGYIEFNPNRFNGCDAFWSDYNDIIDLIPNASLSRFDLAIDIPCPRDKLMLIKDNREYVCFAKSSFDITEYLGQRNKAGRVKLYNKQLESSLTYPLSRLEITGTEDKLNIPIVLDLRKLPSGSDGVLIRTLADSPYRSLTISALTPYMRRTVIKYMTNNQIQFDSQCIQTMHNYVISLASGRRTIQFNNQKEVFGCINICQNQLSAELMPSKSV